MSRIGKKPVPVVAGITVTVNPGEIRIKGPKGELVQKVVPGVTVKMSDDNKNVVVDRESNSKRDRALHGLYRQLVNNMMVGVTQGYSRGLRIVGTGYRVELKGRVLSLVCGYCAPQEYPLPTGIEIEIPKQTSRESMDFIVHGIDKQMVGEVATSLRRIRPPDLYQGKGIRFINENVRRLEGKSFGSGGK